MRRRKRQHRLAAVVSNRTGASYLVSGAFLASAFGSAFASAFGASFASVFLASVFLASVFLASAFGASFASAFFSSVLAASSFLGSPAITTIGVASVPTMRAVRIMLRMLVGS